ncbi:MAG: hypothetical protein VKJ06_06805 [Vampirovibrionales bacterium]|nr:hypothetical protein [Vampirovibrionales bacterium]
MRFIAFLTRFFTFLALFLAFLSVFLPANDFGLQMLPLAQASEVSQAPVDNLPKLPNLASASRVSQTGCCSFHGGVCGCAGASTQCCDGSLSPSCSCVWDPVTQSYWLGRAKLSVKAQAQLLQVCPQPTLDDANTETIAN